MASSKQSQPAPSVDLPKSSSTCNISIINTTCDITVPPHLLVEPNIPGHDWLNLPTYAFHITNNATGKQVLFDMGCRKDWQNMVPHLADLVGNHVPGIRIEKDVVDILTDGGVKLDDIQALILSHWHFDHCGDTSVLPKTCDLLVGPGFVDEFLPGYPTKESSTFPESAFAGRNVIEVPFDKSDLKVGKFQAHDYFGDGSLYILNVPGHATGHISALVRTTPETAIFLGGDVCHFTGMLRPTQYVPLPDTIPSETLLHSHLPTPCPCAVFTAYHPDQKNSQTTPFYKPSTHAASFYADPPVATQSIQALAEFDADPNILIVIAHDVVPKDIMNFFPNGTINDWQKKGWKEKMHWAFVNEFPYEGKTHRGLLIDGLYNDQGKRIKTLEGKRL